MNWPPQRSEGTAMHVKAGDHLGYGLVDHVARRGVPGVQDIG